MRERLPDRHESRAVVLLGRHGCGRNRLGFALFVIKNTARSQLGARAWCTRYTKTTLAGLAGVFGHTPMTEPLPVILSKSLPIEKAGDFF